MINGIRLDPCAVQRAAVADPQPRAEWLAHRRERDPVDPLHLEPARKQILLLADHHRARLRQQLHDVERPRRSNADPAALPDREVVNPLVPPDHLPARGDDRAGQRRLVEPRLLAQKAPVVVVGNEADLHRIRLLRHRNPQLACQRPHRRLVELAERHDEPRELALLEPVEVIGLVLVGVGAHAQFPAAAAVARHAAVVPGRDRLRAVGLPLLEQRAELQPVVAVHARVRRAAGEVVADERLDHLLAEVRLEVDRVEWEAESVRNRARVARIGGRTAGRERLLRPAVAIVPRAHVHADHLGAGAMQQRRRDRAVDAAAHRNDDPPAAPVIERGDGRLERAHACASALIQPQQPRDRIGKGSRDRRAASRRMPRDASAHCFALLRA